jgi:hypothetical protein
LFVKSICQHKREALKNTMKLPSLLLVLTALSVARGELTKEDIIAKEIALARKTTDHFQRGFREDRPARMIDQSALQSLSAANIKNSYLRGG